MSLRSLLLCLAIMAGSPAAMGQESEDTGEVLPITVQPQLLSIDEVEFPPGEDQVPVDVLVLVEIDETGTVVYTEILESAGEAFDTRALAATKGARFSPAQTAEGPVPIAFAFTVSFTPPAVSPSPSEEAAPDQPAPTEEVSPAAASPEPPPSEVSGGDGADDRDETGAEGEPLPITVGPTIETYIEAPYPQAAQDEGLEAEVRLFVTLDEAGTVLDVTVAEPVGNGFDEAASDAVKQMSFTPAQTAEGPVGVVFEFVYAFTLQPETTEEAPPPVNLDGQLRQMGKRLPVSNAIVRIKGLEISALSDQDGRYELAGVPIGVQTIEVIHPDHVPYETEVEITAGELTTADLWIRPLSSRQNEAVAYYERDREEVTRRTLSIEEVRKVPGTFGDPVKVIQTLPGAARSPFGTGLLIIRGSNPEDTAVYVDGVRIPIIYHLTGTTSVLSPDIIEAVDYLPGGYGVEYGRSMGGSIDVRTKRKFKENKIVFGMDVLDAQVYFEGNVGKNKQHGLAIGARRSYIDAFIPLFTRDQDFAIQPIYWDYQAKWIPDVGANDDFSVFVYGFQDILRFGTPDDVAQGTDPDAQGDLSTKYQSHRINMRWTHRFSDKLVFDMTPSFGFDRIVTGLGDDFNVDTTTFILQLRSELVWTPHPAIEIVPGLDFLGGPYNFDLRFPLSFDDLGDPLAERDPIGFDGFGTAWTPAPYLEFRIRPLKDRSRWLIMPGLRFDSAIYIQNGSINEGLDLKPSVITSLDPRIATRFRVFGDEERNGVLKASTGLYHQPPQPFQSLGLGTVSTVGAERSWNSSIGFEHRITPAISWDLDVFYRQMDQLVTLSPTALGPGDQFFENLGEGYAAGFEIIVRHAPIGNFFGWISYTFSRSFRRDSAEDDWIPFDYDQPHIFSAQAGYLFPYDIGLSAQLQVVSGNPTSNFNFSIYDVDGDFYNAFRVGTPNDDRLPTFIQSSFRLDKTWTFKKWQLEAYVDLINALRGVNPEFTTYNYDFTEFAYVRGLPFIPNLGVEMRFYL